MYGSYGSYSSMSSSTSAMDIPTSSTSFHDSSCAFPSWPRRASLSPLDNDPTYASDYRATSYVSDEDLFALGAPPTAADDDTHSISSAESISPETRQLTDAELFERERARLTAQRDVMMLLMAEKERRRQQQAMRKRRGSGGKKSPKTSKTAMAPIEEGAE